MLRVIVQTNAVRAKAYHVGGGEYCPDGQEDAGVWGGRAVVRLGLDGGVGRAEFGALCDNRHPGTGERLTPRTKAARRVGFDLNFHVPKSVSVVYGLTGDRRVLEAFRESVRETLVELETEARTRVRTGGRDATRNTGNLVYAVFVHATARPVDGIPDPHLHAHAFVFNVTHDAVEGRWKAAELREVYTNAPYYEAVFHARLARGLIDLGYVVARRGAGWEIDGVPDRVLKAFSRRTVQIDTLAEERNVTFPNYKAQLGVMTRERKQLRFTLEDLRRIWTTRLTPDERTALARVAAARQVLVTLDDPAAARDAMRFAVAHGFERSSVLPVKRLLGLALRHAVGQVSPEGVERELAGHGLLVREYGGDRLATTEEVLAEERRILGFAKAGRNACRPLAADDQWPEEGLSPGQRSAARHVLTSTGRVTLLLGVAGSGKTTLIAACVAAIRRGGKPVQLLAPTAAASRGVLRAHGFETADTVARFLLDARFRESARSGVVWIDEAGLLGLKSLDALFSYATALDMRVVLSGDDRQHKAVERGSPLTLLRRNAGLEPAAVREIRRQVGRYKDAVALLSRGKTVEGFDLLDHNLGWVREMPEADRPTAIAADYLASLAAGKSVLVVSPTHAEGNRITRAIRVALQSAGKLGADEVVLPRLDARDSTLAQRRELWFYRCGDVIEFHSRAAGHQPGDRYTVSAVGPSTLDVTDVCGRETVLPLHLAPRFLVYTLSTIAIAVGDWVRVSKTSKCRGGKPVDNGTLTRVTSVSAEGGIRLDTGVTLPPGFGHVAHGYVVTSHAAQGRTVDRVLVAQSSESFLASGREQIYVSASRGRETVTVYTDDKGGLRRAIERSDPARAATDLVAVHRRLATARRGRIAQRLQLSGLLEGEETDRPAGRPATVITRPMSPG